MEDYANLVEKIKKSMRIKGNGIDDVILEDIYAGLADLGRLEINTDVTEPLISKCIELYTKWQENYENAADRYERAYNSLRNALMDCGEYKETADAE